jgi:hypothetical protein
VSIIAEESQAAVDAWLAKGAWAEVLRPLTDEQRRVFAGVLPACAREVGADPR